MNKRDAISIGIGVALTAALALGSIGNELLTRGPLNSPPDLPPPTPTHTPTNTPTPTPTATPRPFGLTPRPTSTALTPRPPTPTPQPIAATPGPCTVVLGERSATCKTAYYQPVTWTLSSAQVVTSSLFDGTSRITFDAELRPGALISIAPRWQGARLISVITLTGQVSGNNWLSATTLAGLGPPNAQITLVHHRWHTPTASYRATFYVASTNAQGRWSLSVPGGVLTHLRDYWQVRYTANGVTYVNGILTRRLIFPVVRRES